MSPARIVALTSLAMVAFAGNSLLCRVAAFYHDIGKVRKPQYFVELDKPLAGCLNREIVALTKRGQRVRLVFQEYVSPLEKINSLLRSVKRALAQSASSAS